MGHLKRSHLFFVTFAPVAFGVTLAAFIITVALDPVLAWVINLLTFSSYYVVLKAMQHSKHIPLEKRSPRRTLVDILIIAITPPVLATCQIIVNMAAGDLLVIEPGYYLRLDYVLVQGVMNVTVFVTLLVVTYYIFSTIHGKRVIFAAKILRTKTMPPWMYYIYRYGLLSASNTVAMYALAVLSPDLGLRFLLLLVVSVMHMLIIKIMQYKTGRTAIHGPRDVTRTGMKILLRAVIKLTIPIVMALIGAMIQEVAAVVLVTDAGILLSIPYIVIHLVVYVMFYMMMLFATFILTETNV